MKTALITGSAKRIGREIALHLAQKNYKIFIHYNTSLNEAEELQQLIPNSELICVDLKDKEAAKSILDQASSNINLLINNASIFQNDDKSNYSSEVSNSILQVNLLTPIKLIHELTVRQKSASIINMVDSWAQNNTTNFLSYCQSKNSLAQYTIQAASDLPKGFNINAISIGMALYKEGFPKEIYEELSKKYPSSVEGICKAIDSILSNESLNGQILDITKDAN
jgi:NAD(P)-dependent dehydrogenase (short-subunit alcohol dehydrogenase family)